jgi:type I restriction enzyme S subunit
MDVFGIPRVSAAIANFGLVNSTPVEWELYKLRRGDVLFVRSSVKPKGVGLTTLISEDLLETVFSGFLIRFRDHGQLTLEFKEHCFWEYGFRRRLIAYSTVSANTNINQEALKRLQIGFPPKFHEQCAIAGALSEVDRLVASLDRLISKKCDLKQAAMQQLLTGEKRLAGFSDEWIDCLLSDIAAPSKGKGIRKDEVVRNGLPCIRYGEIYTRHNDYIRAFYSFIPRKIAMQSQRLKQGDLLFAGSGETAAEIGKCVAFLGDEEAYAGGDIVIFHPVRQNSLYLGYLMNHPSIVDQKARLGQGDAVVHISSRNLGRLRLRVPHLEEQTAIAAVLYDIDAELGALEQRRDKTRALKEGMMQELLTGRIRLV